MYVINIIILKWKLGSKILKTEYNYNINKQINEL